MKTTRQLVLVTVVVALVSACGALGSPAPAPGSSEPRTPGEQAAPQATPITVAARVQDLTAAVGALGGLSSYRFSRTSTGTGIIVGPGATVGAAATRRIIVNGTLPRALEETTGISGFPSLSILVIGTDAWSRTGSDAWKKATTDDHPTCGETGQDSSSMKRCTFEAMTDVFAGDRAMAPTFVRIGDGEVVDGVATTHLRSDARVPRSPVRDDPGDD